MHASGFFLILSMRLDSTVIQRHYHPSSKVSEVYDNANDSKESRIPWYKWVGSVYFLVDASMSHWLTRANPLSLKSCLKGPSAGISVIAVYPWAPALRATSIPSSAK